MEAHRAPLGAAYEAAAAFLDAVGDRPVGPRGDVRDALGGPLPERGEAPAAVVERLIAAADPGLIASAGPRYFGFVIGGALPSALAADWLAATWDQDAALEVMSPAAAAAEEAAGSWVKELLRLPAGASFGFPTGAQMANFTGLAAARHEVLRRAGGDVERDGLAGAPRVQVVAGGEVHTTVPLALRYLGLGGSPEVAEADEQGRMRPDLLAAVLRTDGGPAIVCAQAGNVNSGAFDPLAEIGDVCSERGAWLHVDGAFGMWAAASPALAHLVQGIERADSWATDCHKWLNVPYDSAFVACTHPDAHAAAMSWQAAAYVAPGAGREPTQFVPESSRRARGFAVWAALRELGREGVAALVERCCAHARRFAAVLGAEEGVEILNDVVLNQVLVRFDASDARTQAVVRGVQEEGTAWLGGTVWQGRAAMRISVSNWSTTEADVDRSAEAIVGVHRAIRSVRGASRRMRA
jgi:glutamate/tyrosine decarboxylase-like PLP-dependent enzyme